MDLYSEIILDYFKNPVNKGTIERATATVTEHNPLCGDKIRIDLLLDKKGLIAEAKFSGEGCAISQAAASMLTEILIGKTPSQIKKIDNNEVFKMLNIPISPGRIKCALLGLVTAKKAAILASVKANQNKNHLRNTRSHKPPSSQQILRKADKIDS